MTTPRSSSSTPITCRSVTPRAGRSRSARSSTPNSATACTPWSVTRSTAGATLAAGGTYEELFYRPTVLTHIPTSAPAYAEEVFGPVAPVVSFGSLDEAVAMASASPYGLSLSILSGDGLRALELAESHPERRDPHQRRDAGRRGDDPLRRRRRQRQRFAHGRTGQPRRLHRDPVGHRPGRHRLLSVLRLQTGQIDVVSRERPCGVLGLDDLAQPRASARRSRTRRSGAGAASGSCRSRTPRRATPVEDSRRSRRRAARSSPRAVTRDQRGREESRTSARARFIPLAPVGGTMCAASPAKKSRP